MKQKLIAGLCLVVLGSLSIRAADGPGAAPAKAVVETGKVTEVEDTESRRYTGQIVSPAVVQIVPRVSGEILEVGFQDGSYVKQGQMLYRLDPVQYEAAVKSAEAKVAECKAHLEYAQNNFDRNNLLYEKRATSRDVMENTKSSLEAYRASLLAAEAELITARDNLKNTTIVAPMEGVVGVTNFTAGNYITPSSGEMVSIIRVQPIRVCFSISTADFLSMFGSLKVLKENGSVRIRLADGSSYPDEGGIELLNNEANRKTDAIQVYANFPNSDYKLIVGSTVGVTLSKKQGRTVPAVPLSAVMHDNQGTYVYVVDAANKVEKRYIVPENATDELQLVASGLEVGETIVVKGTHKAVPGKEIEPVSAER